MKRGRNAQPVCPSHLADGESGGVGQLEHAAVIVPAADQRVVLAVGEDDRVPQPTVTSPRRVADSGQLSGPLGLKELQAHAQHLANTKARYPYLSGGTSDPTLNRSPDPQHNQPSANAPRCPVRVPGGFPSFKHENGINDTSRTRAFSNLFFITLHPLVQHWRKQHKGSILARHMCCALWLSGATCAPSAT